MKDNWKKIIILSFFLIFSFLFILLLINVKKEIFKQSKIQQKKNENILKTILEEIKQFNFNQP